MLRCSFSLWIHSLIFSFFFWKEKKNSVSKMYSVVFFWINQIYVKPLTLWSLKKLSQAHYQFSLVHLLGDRAKTCICINFNGLFKNPVSESSQATLKPVWKYWGTLWIKEIKKTTEGMGKRRRWAEKQRSLRREVEQVGGRGRDKTSKQMRGKIKERNDRLPRRRRDG